ATTQSQVRGRYGAPTRETTQKVEGYDAVQWVYEGAQAPAGITKMIVDFGLLTASGYRKEVVRTFRLEPKHDIFNRKLIVDGWGGGARCRPSRGWGPAGRDAPIDGGRRSAPAPRSGVAPRSSARRASRTTDRR